MKLGYRQLKLPAHIILKLYLLFKKNNLGTNYLILLVLKLKLVFSLKKKLKLVLIIFLIILTK